MRKWNLDGALVKFRKLKSNNYQSDSLSESDTRSKIIDFILIEVLGWDESNITREERCVESCTYLDYKVSTNIPILIIEAKKTSIEFDLPKASRQREYKIGGVLGSVDVSSQPQK